MTKHIFSIISPPGGGKSTQLKKLSTDLGIPLVSSGDIARQMQENSDTDFIAQGIFAPEDQMRFLLTNKLNDLFSKHSVILADGFPRFVEQYTWLESLFINTKLHVVYLDTPIEVIQERLKERNREDDSESVHNERMKIYLSLTHPIIETFDIPMYSYNQAYDFLKSVLEDK